MPISFLDITIVLTIASITALAILNFFALSSVLQVLIGLSVGTAMIAIAVI